MPCTDPRGEVSCREVTMRTLRILAVLIFLCLSVVARPAIAGDVTVDRVVAAQFSFGYFIAVVVAHGVVTPGDVLTATVSDIELGGNEKSVPCGPGYVQLRQTVFCR